MSLVIVFAVAVGLFGVVWLSLIIGVALLLMLRPEGSSPHLTYRAMWRAEGPEILMWVFKVMLKSVSLKENERDNWSQKNDWFYRQVVGDAGGSRSRRRLRNRLRLLAFAERMMPAKARIRSQATVAEALHDFPPASHPQVIRDFLRAAPQMILTSWYLRVRFQASRLVSRERPPW